MKLIDPSKEYEASYYEFVREFNELHEDMIPYSFNYGFKDLDEVLKREKEFRSPLIKEEGFVPGYTYWLIDQDKIVGAINIRLELNEYLASYGGHIGYGVLPSERTKGYATKILELGLEKCREFNLLEVLIVARSSNEASIKTILHHQGKFIKQVQFKNEYLNQYLITL